ncbi:hypothetical protein J3F83DRAFT_750836 [Trichoderma novae-zelandiae]
MLGIHSVSGLVTAIVCLIGMGADGKSRGIGLTMRGGDSTGGAQSFHHMASSRESPKVPREGTVLLPLGATPQSGSRFCELGGARTNRFSLADRIWVKVCMWGRIGMDEVSPFC